MFILRISLEVSGAQFSPAALLPALPFPHVVFDSHEASDTPSLGPGQATTYGFGSLSLLAPGKIGVAPTATYEQWYVDFLDSTHDQLVGAGVTEINLRWDVFYTRQCHFELFTRQQLARLAPYPVALPVSVYQLSEEQMQDLLADAGWNARQIKRYVAAEGGGK
jgi:hypothetical protein